MLPGEIMIPSAHLAQNAGMEIEAFKLVDLEAVEEKKKNTNRPKHEAISKENSMIR